jgi:pimeloyl-ACP methyl ester carboxylesterase
MAALTIYTRAVDFRALVSGRNPRAVFVHGLGGDLHTWDAVSEALGQKLASLRYDLRGFGESVCRHPVTFRHADDLLAVLDATGIEQCDLIGVSMGASIALNFTLDHPERVRNLVLISPGLTGWEWSEEWRALWQPIVDSARGGAMEKARELWWQHPLFATTRESPAAAALRAAIMRDSGEHWIDDLQEQVLPDLERLHQLQTRTLLMSGGRDLAEFRLMADLIEGNATHLQRIDIASAGHLIPLEEPRICADHIAAFLMRRSG